MRVPARQCLSDQHYQQHKQHQQHQRALLLLLGAEAIGRLDAERSTQEADGEVNEV